MFNSIKYRFITIYFLLVLVSMSIVGVFIINRLEVQQIENIEESMNQTLNTFISSTSYLMRENWNDIVGEIDSSLKNWNLNSNEVIYAISSDKDPKILATSSNNVELVGKNALSYKYLDAALILSSLKGDVNKGLFTSVNSNIREEHLTKPILTSDGRVLGVLYMTRDLSIVYSVVKEAKIIISYATVIALLITTVLGFLMANTITNPIRDLIKKASLMAKGDFNQKVIVKSNDEIGKLGNMFNYLTTELKTTINDMSLEKSKLSIFFTHMAEGVVAVNREGYIIHANDSSKRVLKLSNEYEKMKLNLSELGISNINYYDSRTLFGESELLINGEYFKLKYAPYKRENGANLGLIIVLQNLTKEHDLDVMRKEFVANVSHELKTPITTIKSYTETLLDGDLTFKEMRSFLNIIDRENNRMANLVSDLLQLSNLDYKSLNLSYEVLDVYELVDSSLEALSVLIRDRGHKIILDIPSNIGNVYCDRTSAEQIIINIVSNAIKYTKDSGQIKISARNNGDLVDIIVKDNGIGIPKEDLPRIFERFYRVEKGRSRKMGGTGLGLSIARETARAMGGDISISSEFGSGTEVTINLKGDKC